MIFKAPVALLLLMKAWTAQTILLLAGMAQVLATKHLLLRAYANV